MVEIKPGKNKGYRAVVAGGKSQAAQIGIDILKEGGNAVDAAVAVGFAIGVAEPTTSGIGGGGFMTIKTAGMREAVFVDFREFSPLNADPGMWKFDSRGKVANMENSIGAKSVAVPGEVAGFVEVLERYGTMQLDEVIEPSIDLAERGIEISPMTAGMMNDFRPFLEKYSDARRIFLNNGRGFSAGERLVNHELAYTLRQIAKHGKRIFYEGNIAAAVIDTIQKNGGIMTLQDLRDYRVEIKKPVSGDYRGYTIISSPPPSSGGAHIIQALNILENYDIGSMRLNSSEYLHLFSEVFKLVYEDRAKFMGDTDFARVPIKGIKSKDYARILSKSIDLNRAHNPSRFDPWNYEHDETTHYSIGDRDGNMVSVTKTINHFFGSCMVAEGTGILLNDTMADFSINRYDINTVDRRKKPRSTMAPTIILKGLEPFAIIGSPGGARIINTVTQVISKLIDHDMGIQEAIDSPRITQNASNILHYEDRLDRETIEALENMGHELHRRDPLDLKMGGVHAIRYLEDSVIEGGADPRRDGAAMGF